MGRAGSACRISQASYRKIVISDSLKWGSDAPASTLESRAWGETRALWDGKEEQGLRARG